VGSTRINAFGEMPAPVEISHNILPSRVLFCYRRNDADSLEVAQYYAQQRFLENNQLLALDVPNQNEISNDVYESNIATPILNYIRRTTVGSHETGHPGVAPWAIILGHHIPHVVDYYGEKLAVASRLHRLGHSIPKHPNHTFDRKYPEWRFFNDLDLSELYITAVIDGPTKQDALNLIQRSILVDNQAVIKGNMILDPYGNKLTAEQLEYQDEILTFINRDLPNFGSSYTTTIDIDDPYQDPTVKFLEEDSFYWGWYLDKVSPGMFRDASTMRSFLYNADDTGASDITTVPTEGGNWCNVAITADNPGYAATAGAVDAPGEDAYLHIRPFFEALHHGTGMGEAFLYANRYVDWKLILIGDPLLVVQFPLPYDEADYYTSNKEIIYQTIRAIEEYLNKADRLSRVLDDIVQRAVESNDFDIIDIFYSAPKWRSGIATYNVSKNYIAGLVKIFANYYALTQTDAISTWLVGAGFNVTRLFGELFNEITSQTISSELFYDDDAWVIDFIYIHSKLTLEYVNFIIEVARDSRFENVVYSIASDDSKEGWWFEEEISDFSPMPVDGFPSNYSGRRTRFISPDEYYLRHTEKYFYRVFVDDSGLQTIVDSTEIVI